MITKNIDEQHVVEKIIADSKVCHVSMIDGEGMPYVLPMNFGYQDDRIYLHSAREGGHIRALRQNPNVCIIFTSNPSLAYQHEEVACSYRMKGFSLMCRGQVWFEEDFDEKVKALNIIMKQYTGKAFTYSAPAIKNVMVWIVEIESLSAKAFGAQNPRSPHCKDGSIF